MVGEVAWQGVRRTWCIGRNEIAALSSLPGRFYQRAARHSKRVVCFVAYKKQFFVLRTTDATLLHESISMAPNTRKVVSHHAVHRRASGNSALVHGSARQLLDAIKRTENRARLLLATPQCRLAFIIIWSFTKLLLLSLHQWFSTWSKWTTGGLFVVVHR